MSVQDVLNRNQVVIRAKIHRSGRVEGLLMTKLSEERHEELGTINFIMETDELAIPKGLENSYFGFSHLAEIKQTVRDWGQVNDYWDCTDQLSAIQYVPMSTGFQLLSGTSPYLLTVLSFLLIEVRHIDVRGVAWHKVIRDDIAQRLEGFIREQRRIICPFVRG